MKQAVSELIDDFLSSVLFLVTYGASGSLRAAIGVAVFVGVVPVARRIGERRKVEPMQWASLGLVLALGLAAWLAESPRFIMARPSAVHFALAAAMSRGGWMLRYLNTPAQLNVPKTVVAAAGYAWAVLMAALGFTNLIIALYFDLATWAWFVTVISIGAKIAALALQYAVFRRILRRRLARAAAVSPTSVG
jgi:intracellular septation protein